MTTNAPLKLTANGDLAEFLATDAMSLSCPVSSASSLINVANNLRLYSQSGAPYLDGSGAFSTLYLGGLTSRIQTFVDPGGNPYQQYWSELAIPITGKTAGIPVDIFAIGGGPGSTSGTALLVSWTNATTPSAKGLDSLGRICSASNSQALWVASFDPLSATTTQDDVSCRYIHNILIKLWKPLYCADATTFSYNNSTWGAYNSNTTNGIGRVSVFKAQVDAHVLLRNQAQVSGALTLTPWLGIGANNLTPSASVQGGISLATVVTAISVGLQHTPSVGATYYQRVIASNAISSSWSGTANGVPSSFMEGQTLC